nr:MAG TPA: hypothetical protein [Caudoviricetes sp.]
MWSACAIRHRITTYSLRILYKIRIYIFIFY